MSLNTWCGHTHSSSPRLRCSLPPSLSDSPRNHRQRSHVICFLFCAGPTNPRAVLRVTSHEASITVTAPGSRACHCPCRHLSGAKIPRDKTWEAESHRERQVGQGTREGRRAPFARTHLSATHTRRPTRDGVFHLGCTRDLDWRKRGPPPSIPPRVP